MFKTFTEAIKLAYVCIIIYECGAKREFTYKNIYKGNKRRYVQFIFSFIRLFPFCSRIVMLMIIKIRLPFSHCSPGTECVRAKCECIFDILCILVVGTILQYALHTHIHKLHHTSTIYRWYTSYT